ncbi:MAG: zf-HC2 domain-containing protein [Oscillospiraceae bacterium]|nr:zf-HC2 domain-containing protein [Oscillospiraceae bacterium]
MSDCEKYIEMISAMVDGELTAEQEAELRTHIDSCQECARIHDAFLGISDAFSESLVAPPETLAKGVMYKIKMQKKGGSRFSFGRYTAIAACLALAIFGASYFGLLDGLNMGSSAPAALSRAADESMYSMNSALGDAASGDTTASDAGSNVEESGQAMLTAGVPETENTDGTVLQFGFTENSMAIAENTTGEEKEPAFLFEAKKIQVFEGKYYAVETDKEKNKLLFTISSEEGLTAFSEFLTALPDESAEYSTEDGKIIESEPLFSFLFPADLEKDKTAKDKIINVWFVDGKLWCVISDAELPETSEKLSTEKILYKAEGLQDKFEEFIKKVNKENKIT